MNAVARFAVGRPKHVLAVWLVAVSVLGLVGLHLEAHLHQKADLVIPGTAFGSSGEGHVRACYAASYEQLQEALVRIGRFVEALRT